ncbi:MAG: hypothetical protein KDJ65_36795 [Anaerolineae bacterium]|nr:hypothetical protein [Anaerolineae bacterium]
MRIFLNPKKVSLFFLVIVILLTVANIANFLVAFYYFGRTDISSGYFSIFNLDAEQNIPTLYASISILFCSLLLGLIAYVKRESGEHNYLFWLGLALVFLFLSVDESSVLHNYLSAPLRKRGASGLLYNAWIIPVGIALLIFVLIYLKFLFQLPRKTMILFIVSGAIYVSGAMGIEMIGGLQKDTVGTGNIAYQFMTLFEEFFEMMGILLFIYTLLSYIDTELDDLSISVKSKVQIM